MSPFGAESLQDNRDDNEEKAAPEGEAEFTGFAEEDGSKEDAVNRLEIVGNVDVTAI